MGVDLHGKRGEELAALASSELARWSSQRQVPFYLHEGNVLRELLLDVLQPPERLPEGGEVGDHGPQAALRHKPGQDVPRGAVQQVELHVQGLAFLFHKRAE